VNLDEGSRVFLCPPWAQGRDLVGGAGRVCNKKECFRNVAERSEANNFWGLYLISHLFGFVKQCAIFFQKNEKLEGGFFFFFAEKRDKLFFSRLLFLMKTEDRFFFQFDSDGQTMFRKHHSKN